MRFQLGGKATRKKNHSRPKAKQAQQQQPQQQKSSSASAAPPAAAVEPQTPAKEESLTPGNDDAADLSSSDVEGGRNKSSISVEECAASDADTSGVTSPISAIPPKFNVDSDVLARSPMGSVADLTAVQSDSEGVAPSSGPASLEQPAAVATEAQGETEVSGKPEQAEDGNAVAVTVTSPNGTDRPAAAAEKQEETPSPLPPKESGDAATEESEFTNSQARIFRLSIKRKIQLID